MKIRALTVVLMLAAAVQAAPIEWGGNYYELVSSGGTWDEAKTAAEGLSYNGYIGHLATLNSESEFTFLKTISGLGSWNITWIGGYKNGSDYTWVNGEGVLDFSGWSASPWASGQPNGGYGVAITGSGYGSNIRTQGGTCGEYIVEYQAQAVPEPASALLIGSGGLLIVGYRRLRRWYGQI